MTQLINTFTESMFKFYNNLIFLLTWKVNEL